MLKKHDFKRGDLVKTYYGSVGVVGACFDTWCEVKVGKRSFYQIYTYDKITLLPICKTEIYKALTEGE